MSRKLIAGFRTLLDELCAACDSNGAHAMMEAETLAETRANQIAAERRAKRARNRIERELLPLLMMAHYAARKSREGWAVPQEIHGIADAITAIERRAKMNGRKFARNHRRVTQQEARS